MIFRSTRYSSRTMNSQGRDERMGSLFNVAVIARKIWGLQLQGLLLLDSDARLRASLASRPYGKIGVGAMVGGEIGHVRTGYSEQYFVFQWNRTACDFRCGPHTARNPFFSKLAIWSSMSDLRLRDTIEWAWLMLNFSCLSLRVIIMQNLQSYAFSSLYGQRYLQESARLNFTHTQREIASSLSIFCTRFKNLGTPFATTFLAYEALKGGRGIDGPILHNSIPVQRKLGKTNQSFSNNHTCACSR